MKALKTIALAALLSGGTFAGASAMPAASAPAASVPAAPVERIGHHHHSGRHILPPRAIESSLRHRGYRHIRDMRLIRGDYVLIARGYRGTVRLVVDGRTGRIIDKRFVHARPHRPGVHLHGGNGNFSYSFNIR